MSIIILRFSYTSPFYLLIYSHSFCFPSPASKPISSLQCQRPVNLGPNPSVLQAACYSKMSVPTYKTMLCQTTAHNNLNNSSSWKSKTYILNPHLICGEHFWSISSGFRLWHFWKTLKTLSSVRYRIMAMYRKTKYIPHLWISLRFIPQVPYDVFNFPLTELYRTLQAADKT